MRALAGHGGPDAGCGGEAFVFRGPGADRVGRGQVLAVEGPEGTDEMLKRVAHLSTSMRGSVRKREGVLVKLPKPNQDRRIDMPTIGLTTIENASLAGLSGIAFAGEATQLIDADACVKRADELGMFLIGFKP